MLHYTSSVIFANPFFPRLCFSKQATHSSSPRNETKRKLDEAERFDPVQTPSTISDGICSCRICSIGGENEPRRALSRKRTPANKAKRLTVMIMRFLQDLSKMASIPLYEALSINTLNMLCQSVRQTSWQISTL